jgi:TetR/AcrR family tetracycline transcriptional repressor
MSFAKLTEDRIVDEALALLREAGLAQVSLRKIAARLDVGVSSLYWHVADKDALYALMSARIFAGCLADVPPSRSWEQWLHGFGVALWRAQRSLPDALQLILQSKMDPAVRECFLGQIVATLEGLGLASGLAEGAQRSVQALVTGWSTLRKVNGPGDDGEAVAFEQALGALIAGWREVASKPTTSST